LGNSFQEQLLKAGLVDDKKLKQAKKEAYKKQKQKARKHTAEAHTLAAQNARAKQTERDRALNRQRQQALEQKAVAAQIKQIIEHARQSRTDGDTPYHFSSEGKIHKLHVTNEQHRQLGLGQLAIVRLADAYELVPAAAAEKISQRDASHIMAWHKDSTEDEDKQEDDYAQYQVPDDLIW
jgi:uncharacterized protein YaiL (DUF2058 family)